MRQQLLKEIRFRTSRSSGPGGQHVNKTESRVELLWEVLESAALSPEAKQKVSVCLKNRINQAGVLCLSSEQYRSQARNREDVSERFLELILACLEPEKERRVTRPTRSSKEKRLDTKKKRGEIKRLRRKGPEGL